MTNKRFDKNTQSDKQEKKKSISLKFINVFLFTAFIVSGSFYIFNINQVTVKGFCLQELKSNVDYLAETNRSLEDEINAGQSYYAFNSRINCLSMVEASDVVYIESSKQVVAKK